MLEAGGIGESCIKTLPVIPLVGGPLPNRNSLDPNFVVQPKRQLQAILRHHSNLLCQRMYARSISCEAGAYGAAPHIGHLHSLVLTDVLARYSKLRNPQRDVVFTTGTDEHGLKIQQAAKAQGIAEEDFCARVSQRFRVILTLACQYNADR